MTSLGERSAAKNASSFPSKTVGIFIGISGAVALVYEVVWQRQFALVFGSSAPATAAILAAYFAGLGLGSWVVGSCAARITNPLRAYAGLELSIGIGALLVGPFISLFEQIYPWCFQTLSGSPNAFLILRTALAFLALLIPTFCMGGTLPLLSRRVGHQRGSAAVSAGLLYVANTVGAAAGALLVPFFLLPHFGLRGTTLCGAAVNTAIALGALLLSLRRFNEPAIASAPKIKSTRREVRPEPFSAHSIALLALISGAATFALQVLWNRAFAQVHENSMYSFAIIVAVVIAGLAAGAQLARSALRRRVAPHRVILVAWLFGGLAVVVSPWLFLKLSNGLSYLNHGEGWTGEAAHLVGLASAVLFVPMALLGVTFPTLIDDLEGPALGRLLVVNVIGSVLGAIVSGFLLPGWLGLWASVIWLGLFLIAAGLTQAPAFRTGGKYSIAGYMIFALWLTSAWPLRSLVLPRVSLESAESEQLVSLTEGAHGITAVVERPGSRRLKLNNHYGLGGTASTGDERMQAHIPLLLHPDPRRVAFLGLGTGITAGAALFHPVDQITVMELVPEVVSASREFFREANGGVIDDPRTRVIADDARHFLRGSGERFDVIVGDLVVPWRQGEGSLFTLEHFTAARDALAPGGVFCQWLPLFQLSESELNILLRTYLRVFPRAQLWRGDFSPTEPALALIASKEELRLDSAAIRRRLAEMKRDSTNPQLTSPEDFWMNYVGEITASAVSSTETRLNRDDQPWVEMLGPMAHTSGNEGAVFTGRRLQRWLDHAAERPQQNLGALEVNDRKAIEAGRILADMTLCLSEGNRAGAKAAQDRLRALLSDEAFRLLF